MYFHRSELQFEAEPSQLGTTELPNTTDEMATKPQDLLNKQ